MSLQQIFYSVEQMAEILHRSPWTIYRDTSRRSRCGKVDLPPFIKIGNRILFSAKGLEQWISQKEDQNGSP
jgi:Helix-turn-helix domain